MEALFELFMAKRSGAIKASAESLTSGACGSRSRPNFNLEGNLEILILARVHRFENHFDRIGNNPIEAL